MALQSRVRRLTNRTWPLESICDSICGAYVNIGDIICGAYVNIGDMICGAYVNIGDIICGTYVMVSSDLNTPFLGQNGPFSTLIQP